MKNENKVVKKAMKLTEKDVRPPKVVRDGIVKPTAMKATIHFTEDGHIHLDQLNILDFFCSTNPQLETTHQFAQTKSELEKLRLEAVIQKEAEEKYPFCNEEYVSKGNELYKIKLEANQRQYNRREEYISWWQSLIERLPSEEEYEKIAWQWAVMYKEIKSKLLPSLPSTLSCEYSEENGKIEVKKIWL